MHIALLVPDLWVPCLMEIIYTAYIVQASDFTEQLNYIPSHSVAAPENLIDRQNHFHNILRLFHSLSNFFTTREREGIFSKKHDI